MSNIDAVLAEAQQAANQHRSHTATITNDAEYAVYLQAKAAFYVMNDDEFLRFTRRATSAMLEARARMGEFFSDSDHAEALEEGAKETIEFYQSVIGTTDRPGSVRLPPRPVHPGQVADDTGVLVNSYHHEVT